MSVKKEEIFERNTSLLESDNVDMSAELLRHNKMFECTGADIDGDEHNGGRDDIDDDGRGGVGGGKVNHTSNTNSAIIINCSGYGTSATGLNEPTYPSEKCQLVDNAFYEQAKSNTDPFIIDNVTSAFMNYSNTSFDTSGI